MAGHPSPTAPDSPISVSVSAMVDKGVHDSLEDAKAELPTPNGSHPLSFPEGGWTAWLTVAGGIIVYISTFGAIQSFGVFQDYYTRISLNDHTPSEVSWFGSFQIFLLFAMGLFSGKMFDEGYFHHLMLGGTVIYLFSFFMLSLTKPHQYYQIFLSQGVGIGLGMGLIFLPAVTIPSHYFRARRSTAMGIVSAGGSVGGVIFPIMLNRLLHGKAGFPWGVRATAFLMTGLLLIANLIMKTRLPNRKNRPTSTKPSMRAMLTDVPYLVCVLGLFLVFWGLFFPIFYLQLFSVLHGVPQQVAFYSITILNGASVFGRTLPNYLADYYGPLNVIIPASFVSGILIFAMFGAGSTEGMVIFAVLYGFSSGAFVSLCVPVVAAFATNVNEVGSRVGIGMFLISFALLTGTPLTGALLDPPLYLWYRPIIFSGVVVLTGTALLCVARSIVRPVMGARST